MKSLQPLFSQNKKTYTYNVPLDAVRSKIQVVFAQAAVFSGPDIRGGFTSADTFEFDCPVPAAAGGAIYRSKLYGSLRQHGDKTVIETHTKPARAVRQMFWVFIVLGIGGLTQKLVTGNPVWPPLALLILGPLAALMIAKVNNGVVEDRYHRYIDKITFTPQ